MGRPTSFLHLPCRCHSYCQVWDIITNQEAVAISQTWAGSPGVAVAQWQALNVPTLVAAQCPPASSSAASSRLGGLSRANGAPSWQPQQQHSYTYLNTALAAGNDLAVGIYNLSAAEALCSSLPACAGFTYEGAEVDPAPGTTVYFKSALNANGDATWSSYARDYTATANLTGWELTAAGLLRQGVGGVCVDAAGQQPQVNAPNWMRMRACDASAASQVFSFNASTRQLVSNSTGLCLAFAIHWLWDWQPVPSLASCQNDTSQFFSFGPDGTLVNAAQGLCAGSSDVSGPPSQVWAKPIASPPGAVAVLVVNGALLNQSVTVPLALVNVTDGAAAARDVWEHMDLGIVSGNFTVSLGPHDSALLLLSPAA